MNKDIFNENEPCISIVLAVYNAAETLRSCLDSIINQSYRNKEILIIDGNSSDQTREILQEYTEHIAYQVSEPDRGIYDAWNKALKKCRGDYIAFIGADDTYANDEILMQLMKFASKNPRADFISGRAVMLNSDGNLRRLKGAEWQWSKFKRAMGVIEHRGALHHRRLFEQYGQFNPHWRIAGDYEFMLRAGPHLQTLFFPEVIVKAKTGGVSTRMVLLAYKELFQVQKHSPYISDFQAGINLILNLVRYVTGNLKYKLRKKIG